MPLYFSELKYSTVSKILTLWNGSWFTYLTLQVGVKILCLRENCNPSNLWVKIFDPDDCNMSGPFTIQSIFLKTSEYTKKQLWAIFYCIIVQCAFHMKLQRITVLFVRIIKMNTYFSPKMEMFCLCENWKSRDETIMSCCVSFD